MQFKLSPLTSFGGVIGLAYLVGLLSYYHFIPAVFDLLIGLQMVTVVTLGLLVAFLANRERCIVFSLSSLLWLLLVVLIFIQPLINTIDYPDSLIFSISACFLLMLVSLAVKQMVMSEVNGQQRLSHILAIFLLLGGLLTEITLWLQLYAVNSKYLVGILDGTRPVSNIGQPNQAAFVLCLAIVAVLYLYNLYHKFKYRGVILAVIFLFLAAGIALTASRGGLMMMFGIPVLYALIAEHSIKKRIFFWASFSLILLIGYTVGLFIFEQNITTSNAVSRISNESDTNRIQLQQLAISLFSEHPLTGFGWGNFAKGAFEKASESEWLILSHHSHVLITHIAAELGVLGILLFIPFLWIMYKNFNFHMSPTHAFVVMIVVLMVIYSMSEFPLWYLRFSLIFAVCIALIDQSAFKIKPVYNLVLIAMSIFLCIASIYYQKQYLKFFKYATAVYAQKLNTQQIGQIENVFGFTNYKDQFIYYSLPLDDLNLDQKIALGERVLANNPTSIFIEKQGIFEALNLNSIKALQLFKVRCVFKYRVDCDEMEQRLKYFAETYPPFFEPIYPEFIKWRQLEKQNK